ncbi:MAG: aldo/keto reductase [Mycobacterium sp.]
MMHHTKFGTTDMSISRVGFGSWAMSGPNSPSYWGPQEDNTSVATIRRGIELGINWIDTAAIYGMGHAERIVAEAISVYSDADRPLVFTKGGLAWDKAAPDATVTKCGKRESILAEADASLRRLGVDRIDLYQMHWPANDAEVQEYWSAFGELLQSGKVRAIGLSNHSVEQLEAAAQIAPVHAIQVPLSLVNTAAADSLLVWAAEHGAGTLLYSPMASGLLTGKYRGGDLGALDDNDWRRRSPLFTPENLARVDQLVDVLAEIAAAKSTTVSAVAVAWTLTRPGATAAIVGARTPEQVNDWIDAGTLTFEDAELAALDRAQAQYASAQS